MKFMYQLSYWPPGEPYRNLGLYPSVLAAMDATEGIAEETSREDWEPGRPGAIDECGFWLTLVDPCRWRECRMWGITAEPIPETDAERIELAIRVALEFGQVNGAHHKMWVIDQILRYLAGNHYEEIINNYCDGVNGPDTRQWDEGVAP